MGPEVLKILAGLCRTLWLAFGECPACGRSSPVPALPWARGPAGCSPGLVRCGVLGRASAGSGARGPVPQAHGAGPLDADPTWGYLTAPGEEQRFAHPSGGDVCTSISGGSVLWRSLAGEPTRSSRAGGLRRCPARAAAPPLPGRHGRRRRRLRVGRAAAGAVGERGPAGGAGPTPATDRLRVADRRLVGEARAAILADHPAARGLFPLAELLAVSPYRLSRAVTRELASR